MWNKEKRVWEIRLEFIKKSDDYYMVRIYLDWICIWTMQEPDWFAYYNSLEELNKSIEPLRHLPNIDLWDYTVVDDWMERVRFAR